MRGCGLCSSRLLTEVFLGCFCGPGFGPAAEVLFFASPKKSTQKKGESNALPFGFAALLEPAGVGLNSLRSDNAHPDPAGSPLLASA